MLWLVWYRFFLRSSVSRLLETVPNAPTTTGITVTFMLHCFFNSHINIIIIIPRKENFMQIKIKHLKVYLSYIFMTECIQISSFD